MPLTSRATTSGIDLAAEQPCIRTRPNLMASYKELLALGRDPVRVRAVARCGLADRQMLARTSRSRLRGRYRFHRTGEGIDLDQAASCPTTLTLLPKTRVSTADLVFACRSLPTGAGIHHNTVNNVETERYAGGPETIAAMRKR